MKPPLVIGQDSFIGRALVEKIGGIGTTRRKNAGGLYLDLSDAGADLSILPPCQTAYICAAINGESRCASAPAEAQLVNAVMPGKIATYLASQGTPVVFVSSNAAINSVGIYGETKKAGEEACLAAGAQIIRLSKVWSSSQRGIVGEWVGALGKQKAIDAFVDQFIAPLSLCDAISAIASVAKHDERIAHAGAIRSVSYFDTAAYVAKRLGCDQSVVRPVVSGRKSAPPFTPSSWFDAPDPYKTIDSILGDG